MINKIFIEIITKKIESITIIKQNGYFSCTKTRNEVQRSSHSIVIVSVSL